VGVDRDPSPDLLVDALAAVHPVEVEDALLGLLRDRSHLLVVEGAEIRHRGVDRVAGQHHHAVEMVEVRRRRRERRADVVDLHVDVVVLNTITSGHGVRHALGDVGPGVRRLVEEVITDEGEATAGQGIGTGVAHAEPVVVVEHEAEELGGRVEPAEHRPVLGVLQGAGLGDQRVEHVAVEMGSWKPRPDDRPGPSPTCRARGAG
jgi:hypothetical protein